MSFRQRSKDFCEKFSLDRVAELSLRNKHPSTFVILNFKWKTEETFAILIFTSRKVFPRKVGKLK